jgi:hypothetical protein
MYRHREPVRLFVQRLRLDWRLKLVLFATLLALVEEAITTGMTNLAPVFGVPLGRAYITASANYLDVVFFHSVIVFVPLFTGWAAILSRVRFPPFHAALLFGCTGILAESSLSGLQAVLEFALWIPVYGLMLYLPAYTAPDDRPASPPRWWHYPLAVVLPLLFEILVPTALLPHLVDPHHPALHFPPLQG